MAEGDGKYRKYRGLYFPADREGARLRHRKGRRLFFGGILSRLRAALQPQPGGRHQRRAHRQRRKQAERPGFCPLEEREGGRDLLGFSLGKGPPRLAHRMLRDEPRGVRRSDRPARRRKRPHFPASRKRDRADGGPHGQALCEILDAQRAHQGKRTENEQIARQFAAPVRSFGPLFGGISEIRAALQQLPERRQRDGRSVPRGRAASRGFLPRISGGGAGGALPGGRKRSHRRGVRRRDGRRLQHRARPLRPVRVF